MSSVNYEAEYPIIRKLSIASLVFAILAIPAVVLQSSESAELKQLGEISGVLIWVFFCIEITVLLRIWEDNIEFLKGHVLEVIVVIASSPLFLLAYESESFFGIAPFLRMIRFAKFVKIGKIGKTIHIFRKDESLPKWSHYTVWAIATVLGISILGLILDTEAHSLSHGFTYWFHLLEENFSFQVINTVLCLVVFVISALLVHRAHIQRKTKADQWRSRGS